MRDCTNGEVRDRLPELMHNRLDGETLRAVRAHVDGCADCRAELQLLAQIRGVSAARRMDTSRIVASLPQYRAVPTWRRAVGSAQLRAAAAVVLLIGAYALIGRDAPGGAGEPAAQVQTGTAPAAAAHELAVGDSFTDLSDSDLAAVIDEIGKLEAVMPEATDELVLPIGDGSGSGGGA
jgi:hypothetical protein